MARARFGHRPAAAWALALVLPLSGCVTQPDGAKGAGSFADGNGVIDADWSRLGNRGYVYLQANTDGRKHYELFRADLADGEVEQITHLPGPFGISNFSVSPAGLVVADASSLSDEAKWLRSDGSLAQLPGPRVLSPKLNERGDVLASIATGPSESLAILRHGDTRWARIHQVAGWPATVWLRDAAVAVISIGRRRTTWSVLKADGRRGPERVLANGPYFPGYVTHYRHPVLMTARRGTTGLLWRPGQRPTPLPSGWEDGCVSPDGRRILLMSHRRLGVLDVDDLAAPVRKIGTFGTSILGCGWVDEKFGR